LHPFGGSRRIKRFLAGVFLGPVCDYVIAPVARYAGVWGVPVITAGGQADAFHHKTPGQYSSLTRMTGSYSAIGHALKSILNKFGWSVAGLLYHNHGVGSGKRLLRLAKRSLVQRVECQKQVSRFEIKSILQYHNS